LILYRATQACTEEEEDSPPPSKPQLATSACRRITSGFSSDNLLTTGKVYLKIGSTRPGKLE
jgi:hypothetical protein